jgi:hypothetical protein
MFKYLLAVTRWGNTLTNDDWDLIDRVTFWQLLPCPRPVSKLSKRFSNLEY